MKLIVNWACLLVLCGGGLCLAVDEREYEAIMREEIRPWYDNHPKKVRGTFHEDEHPLKINYVMLEQDNPKGSLFFLPGKSESFLNYLELFYDLKDMGFNIYAMDHRNQGFSGHELGEGKEREKVYVKDFKSYVDDARFFFNLVKTRLQENPNLSQKVRDNIIGLSHSMGARIMVSMQASKKPSEKLFKSMLLETPMFEIPLPLNRRIINVMIAAKTNAGLDSEYVLGGSGWSAQKFTPHHKDDAQKTSTYSQKRFNYLIGLEVKHPELRSGSATFRWVGEVLKYQDMLPGELKKITIPTTILLAEEEYTVSNKNIRKLCQNIPHANWNIEVIEKARHWIFNEEDYYQGDTRFPKRVKALSMLKKFLLRP